MLAATTKLLLGSAFVATAAAQHSDPFAGSGCNCTAFGENECAINATAPTNLTLYVCLVVCLYDWSLWFLYFVVACWHHHRLCPRRKKLVVLRAHCGLRRVSGQLMWMWMRACV